MNSQKLSRGDSERAGNHWRHVAAACTNLPGLLKPQAESRSLSAHCKYVAVREEGIRFHVAGRQGKRHLERSDLKGCGALASNARSTMSRDRPRIFFDSSSTWRF